MKLSFLSPLFLGAVAAQKCGLHTAAKAAGKLYFGTATDNPELTDRAYVAILNNTADFGQITPGNSMKWDATEPRQNVFDFTRGDIIANLARSNNQLLRCHTLVWHSQLPSWVSSGKFSNATLISILQNHVTKVVQHYKGRCYAWDVVNEAFDDGQGNNFRDSVFYKTIGEAFVPIAFKAAADADPGAKLYYNDYGIETWYKKSQRVVDLVKMIKAHGARIDGVGLQAHLEVRRPLSVEDVTGVMNRFTALDVDVAITELDVRMKMNEASDEKRKVQSTIFANVVKGCKAVKRCVGVTIWDFTDKFSWVPQTFKGEGEALVWDARMQKKPSYEALLNAWGTGSCKGG